MSTRIVHCKKESYDVYIGRPSRFGNPFSHLTGTMAKFYVSSREEAIEKYKEWLMQQPELIRLIKTQLKDKVLVCWCKPKSCHGDIIVSICDEQK